MNPNNAHPYPTRVVAVVMAAGASRRMGENKMLLRLSGESLVRRVTRRVLEAGFDAVWVVVGRDAERVKGELEGLPVQTVENPRYPEGLGTSFRAAVEALPDDVEAAMFALADQVFVTSEMYRSVLEAYRTGKPMVVISQFGEVKAPPHIFRRELFPHLGQNKGEGARGVVARHKAEAVVVPMPESALFDLDEPAEYREALQRVAEES